MSRSTKASEPRRIHVCALVPRARRQLSRLHLVAPRLTLLHVGGCRNLTGLQLRCPKLTQLFANLCLR